MDFEEDRQLSGIGERFGFVSAYLLFTTMLFFILLFLNKLPAGWTYIHIIGLTVVISVLGYALERILK